MTIFLIHIQYHKIYKETPFCWHPLLTTKGYVYTQERENNFKLIVENVYYKFVKLLSSSMSFSNIISTLHMYFSLHSSVF